VIPIDPGSPAEALRPALLGHYDLSGALYGYNQNVDLVQAMQAVGFAEWRVGLGRWEASTRLLPTLTDGTPCWFPLPEMYAPAGSTDLDLITTRDWFIDDGTAVTLPDTLDDTRYALGYVRSVLDTAVAFGAEPYVSIDHMPRALAVSRDPERTDCSWTFMNRVSNVRPADPTVFAAAVVGLVQRVVEGAGGEPGRAARYWEVWNEPELPFFWDPAFEDGPGALDRFFEMAALTLVQLDAYRSASTNPAAADLRFGMASFASAGVAASVVTSLDTNPLPGGGVLPLDFISFHAYGNDPLAIVGAIESVAAAVESSTNYGDLELVLAEWGPDLQTTGGDLEFASSMEPPLLMSTVITLGAAAGLDRAHHSIFWDFYPGNVITWGLLDHDVNPRPLYRAYELLTMLISDGAVRLQPTGFEDGRLDGGTGAVLAARDAGDTTRVLFVNRSETVRTARVDLAGSPAQPTRLLVFDQPADPVREVAPEDAVFDVPARSLVLAEFDAEPEVRNIEGRVLVVRDREGEPTARRIVVKSRDTTLAPPAPGQEPSSAGAVLRLVNPTSGEEAVFALPGGSSWEELGQPAGSTGYRYSDRAGDHGPCRSLLWKPGKVLRAVCVGRNGLIPFTLDEPTQGSLTVTVQFGDESGYCMSFDDLAGTVVADRSVSAARTGLFKARNAARPSACPLP
jgi:hypothetical protein